VRRWLASMPRSATSTPQGRRRFCPGAVPVQAALQLSARPPGGANTRTSANLIAYKGDDMAASQNTLPVLIGGTLSTSIKSVYVNKMTEVSKAADLSLSRILDRAIGFWLEVEAPVYLDRAKRKA
jgi:hypothetical protein